MNIEITDLDMILNYLETTSLEPHDDYSSEFTYKDQKILYKYIKQLQQEVKKQKEVIDKAIEYVEGHKYTMKHYEPYGTPTGLPNYETHNIKGYHQLLDILKEVSE